ncbi:MAG: hypothetical protein K9G67_06175 [Bacteroidales bacterium]|nr:hypothetical protein [Bacteroidales bacterium]MCF8343060.1 hypothetical protein [Bacteroidales bacterium]MCF8349803.1 hypothetical protein [Bacteroidales bacterium]MCF8375923.1 hypothetical protein [Bacteroidales bacterium]
MIKRNLFFALLALIVVACGSNQKNDQQITDQSQITTAEPVVLAIADYSAKAGELVGQEVIVEGLVDHVCAHGGERMFLVATDTDERVKVVTAEDMPSFSTDMEGETVVVTGVLDELRIDSVYLAEWEEELKMNAEQPVMEEGEEGDQDSHEGSQMGEKADQGQHVAGMEQIESYRKQMNEKGVDHLSFYSIVCNKYKIKE